MKTTSKTHRTHRGDSWIPLVLLLILASPHSGWLPKSIVPIDPESIARRYWNQLKVLVHQY